MKIVGLIAEYNPFHNGHKFHIEQAKEITGADTAIVIMSGDFVQRGAPAIIPKHLRAKMALQAGADLVFELPTTYASGSAEYFAKGAVSLLDQLGCVDSLCFGCESGDLVPLTKIADILCNEPEDYKTLLAHALKKGDAFPLARQKALSCYLNDPELDKLLAQPNNILGIEYLKAIAQLKSTIQPYCIQRQGADYHDASVHETYSSASAIRSLISSEAVSHIAGHVPCECEQILKETFKLRYPVYADDFSLLLKYRLMQETKETLTSYIDITPELSNRIYNHLNSYISFGQFCELLKTRTFTYTRISRALLHVLLGIRKDTPQFVNSSIHYYAHLLGFRKEAAPVLRLIKENSALPILSKLTAADELIEHGKAALKLDIYASDLYETVITDKFHTPFISELEQQIIRI